MLLAMAGVESHGADGETRPPRAGPGVGGKDLGGSQQEGTS